MPERKFATDMGSWKRLGRRWVAILSVMLCGNFFLIMLAVAGFGGPAPKSGAGTSVVAADEPLEGAAVTSEAANAEPTLTADKPAEVAEIAATVVPAPAQGESAKTESIVQTEPQPQQASEPEQQPAPEPAKVVQDDTVPLMKDEAVSSLVTDGAMVIVNPSTTGGAVHFVVEGEIYSLPAGTYRRFAGNDPKRVVFHKGDDGSDTQQDLETGLFAFAVGSTGWELGPVDSKDSQKVLQGCRLAAE